MFINLHLLVDHLQSGHFMTKNGQLLCIQLFLAYIMGRRWSPSYTNLTLSSTTGWTSPENVVMHHHGPTRLVKNDCKLSVQKWGNRTQH